MSMGSPHKNHRYVFIADFFADQVLGGGELNNEELILLLAADNHEIIKINSDAVTKNFIDNHKNDRFIIANFININKTLLPYFYDKEYIIYEHDHKYLTSRNPGLYPEFKAPQNEIVNVDFYKHAAAVLCQSQFHLNIIKKNLDLANLVSLGGNIWSESSLDLMEKMASKKKADVCSIMDSPILHKNTQEAVYFCEHKERPYKLISSQDYETFLDKLSDNKTLVFFPKTPETLSRVVVEARMMGMSVVVNKMIGATREGWYKLKGKELIDFMRSKRIDIKEKVKTSFDQVPILSATPWDIEDINLMLSYPRSGSTFVRYIIEYFTKRSTIGPSNVGVDLPVMEKFRTSSPIAYKDHAENAIGKHRSQTFLARERPLIFLIRNPMEVFPRHTSVAEAEEIIKSNNLKDIPDTISYYFEHLKMYEEYEGKKQIFYYEDLVQKPAEFIKKICDFLEVDKDGKAQKDFMDDYESHSRQSRSFYNLHQSSPENSFLLEFFVSPGDTAELKSRDTTVLSVKHIIDNLKKLIELPGSDSVSSAEKSMRAALETLNLNEMKIYDCLAPPPSEPATINTQKIDIVVDNHAAAYERMGEEFHWRFLKAQFDDDPNSGPIDCIRVYHGSEFLKKENPDLISLMLKIPTRHKYLGTRSDGKTVKQVTLPKRYRHIGKILKLYVVETVGSFARGT